MAKRDGVHLVKLGFEIEVETSIGEAVQLYEDINKAMDKLKLRERMKLEGGLEWTNSTIYKPESD